MDLLEKKLSEFCKEMCTVHVATSIENVLEITKEDYDKIYLNNGVYNTCLCRLVPFASLVFLLHTSTSEEDFIEKVKGFILIKKIRDKIGDKTFTSSRIRTKRGPLDLSSASEIRKVLDSLVEAGELIKRGLKYSLNKSEQAKVEEETFNDDDLSEEYRLNLEEEIKKYKRFVITTAVAEKKVNEKFLLSIENYAKRNNALVLILPSDIRNVEDSLKAEEKKAIELDPLLKKFKVVTKDIMLNDNLCVCSIKTSAKQINTLTGLDRIAAKKDASIIVASTKHFLKYIPNRKNDIPKALTTTGAITEANYDTDKYLSKRTAYLAENDHICGAIIVEIADKRLFHLRHTTATEEGSFTDLGIEYFPDGSASILENNVLVEGDSHTEGIDEELHKETMKLVQNMNVSTLVLHDIFNATSISHHDKGLNLTRALKAYGNRLSLEEECKMLKRYLEVEESHVDEVVVVDSNHNRHLDKYIEQGRYIEDPQNYYWGHVLALAAFNGENPLEHMIVKELGLNSSKIKWLKEDESYIKHGIELGIHGDRGANGAKGNLTIFEKGVWNCVTAHTHTATIIRNSYSVGTIAKLDQGYNKGFSNWTRTCCLCYSNGVKQLINFIPSENEEGYSWRI